MPCTPFSVDLEVATPDKLRRIVFGLERSCNDDDTAAWMIHFELHERDSPAGVFLQIVKLDISVNHENNDKAEITAKRGMNEDQAAQALVAGDTAKAMKKGQATPEDVKEDALAVVAVRDI